MRLRVMHSAEGRAQGGGNPGAFSQRENRGTWLRRFSPALLAWLLCVTLLAGTVGSAAVRSEESGSAGVFASIHAGARLAADEGVRFVRDLQIIYQGSYLQPLVVEAAAPAMTSAVCKTVSTHAEPAAPKAAKSRS